MSDKHVALVVGSSGIIGSALVDTLFSAPEWSVRALRKTNLPGVEAIDCDLSDAKATRLALEAASDTTHVFYAALQTDPELARESEINTVMLRNVLDGLKANGAPLQRVVHYQGAKVYGVHLGASVAPFYEDDPRHVAANFYYAQEDLLRERQVSDGLDWSILRPDVVVGDIAGNPMNIAMVIGVFAALSKQAGVPLRFPGSMRTYREVVAQLTDAHWLARASLWAALAPTARNEAFNLVGEPFRWERIWIKIAEALNMEVATPQPFSLAKHMPGKAKDWERLATEHELSTLPYDKLVGWPFGDFIFNTGFDMISDMNKIRRAGFTEVVNNEEIMVDALKWLAEKGFLPSI
ncbi:MULTISPECIES: SDR family oxidoreductase [Pseudomonas]|jgi:nucleoside-diphosphate-sugar epimerase|uniref:Nucleoside-diphosphate-sugar epimerase n=2 Tax=Pseudomonas TaxID=286 RepID=A0A1H5L8H9_9PSED|nr:MULTISPECIES: SDR family oxidoreductase [Pseudomonas]MBD0677968.1 NAD-dependent epimerase [Pseudomonas sp. PSB11]NWC80144.1 SDR family oxidoreductase [Pseudomonas putida]NWL21398.1 NAD-dependent epimerase [Pseudomonas umsongensis]SEE73369.1 Nucleoside-diphosphate-sugar epimerase [Pseudomonas migulae]